MEAPKPEPEEPTKPVDPPKPPEPEKPSIPNKYKVSFDIGGAEGDVSAIMARLWVISYRQIYIEKACILWAGPQRRA